MNTFFSQLRRYQGIIFATALLSFVCAFLHLQNFDPSHPTSQNVSCIQGLPQCASYREPFFSIVNILLFFWGLYMARYLSRKLIYLNVVLYMEDYLYVPILFDPIHLGIRRGILHSKYH